MNEPDNAQELIEQLQLSPHPEGGWYRETYRGPNDASGRSKGTAILFLLEAGDRSHWHRVDADELWIWQGGDPLLLQTATEDSGPVHTITLGSKVAHGHVLQALVPAHEWQAAVTPPPQEAAHHYALVSCVVVPGFDFGGFTLARPGWHPGCGDRP